MSLNRLFRVLSNTGWPAILPECVRPQMQSVETRAIDTGSGDAINGQRSSALARVEAAARRKLLKMRRTVENRAWQWYGVNASMQRPLIASAAGIATAQSESAARPAPCVGAPP
jgi:hypothetical protein